MEEVPLTGYVRDCRLTAGWSDHEWAGVDRDGRPLQVWWTTEWPVTGAELHAYEITDGGE
ncbi:hypothetical protein AB0E62_00460 [Streptomyces sp. NPDC038707]|uniref:hypothetical protein n=1 Tax=Streptomyces sp. NPDC038707 TaxID=3154329 RepID=UPI0033C705A6